MTGSADAAPGSGPDPRADRAPAAADLPSGQRSVDPSPAPAGDPDDVEPPPGKDGEGGRYVPL
jgi:hypothetical protein